jgi:hypothetical protein
MSGRGIFLVAVILLPVTTTAFGASHWLRLRPDGYTRRLGQGQR